MTPWKTAEQSRLCTLQGGTTGTRTVSASTKELTAAPNSESGHNHPDRDTSGESVTGATSGAKGTVSLFCEPSEDLMTALPASILERIKRAVIRQGEALPRSEGS